MVLLTGDYGLQSVHIAPEAFTVATAEFKDEVQAWQDALPGDLKGQLASVSFGMLLMNALGTDEPAWTYASTSSLAQKLSRSTATTRGWPSTPTHLLQALSRAWVLVKMGALFSNRFEGN